jgi:plastocyanin
VSRRPAFALVVGVVLAFALTLSPLSLGSGDAGTAADEACIWTVHTKRVVKRRHVIRHGKKVVRKVKRTKRWISCDPDVPPGPTAPDRLLVKSYDTYTFSLSRTDVTAGQVTVQLWNRGEDGHDLHLQQGGSGPEYSLPETLPNQVSEGQFPLTPGTWTLWCSVSNHRALGMEKSLTVN